ncbi:DUF1801 domain-containing protein [Leptospira sp. 201903070]|jgi:Domain of unknown function (DU1801)|uniref:DUF1801 domain-containing protein n=1 Tax=Leptospira ainlahdjerensis TaxID=2810033 RepID=A0ABS2UFN7_9LEPT|nr:DUF1801 domain-containing protein [Leptospira ainlahdjerensis]MBM9579191.1 DUF1801 domain-containing protein [Leptospira ainlahdjerensis]
MKNFESFFTKLTEEEKEIVLILREIVFDCIPKAKEKISYNVPYFSLKQRICFIWPSSVPFGPKFGVEFGFCRGHLLSDPRNLLFAGKRKVVRSISYLSKKEIDPKTLLNFLLEAVTLDDDPIGSSFPKKR